MVTTYIILSDSLASNIGGAKLPLCWLGAGAQSKCVHGLEVTAETFLYHNLAALKRLWKNLLCRRCNASSEHLPQDRFASLWTNL